MPVLQEIQDGDVPVGFHQHDARDARDGAAKPFKRGLKRILEKHPGVGKRMGKNSSWVRQMGSLGGGNHFSIAGSQSRLLCRRCGATCLLSR